MFIKDKQMSKWKNVIAAALLAASSQAWAVPTLSTEVTPNPATVGSSVDVDVRIADVTDLYGYQFTLNYDASVLRAIGYGEGAFLGTAGTTDSFGGFVDNGAGTISFVYGSLVGAIPGASGSGSLAQFRFEALRAGSSTLSFSDLLFLDSSLRDIAVTLDAPAEVGVVPEPASLALFGIGLAGAAALRRRRPSAQA
ncbi:hypothetical protein ASF77_04540 [Massilia sp. Leaf139]|nr:hypothetical protein ASF77_04540 [Massilia sp. Leaf139]